MNAKRLSLTELVQLSQRLAAAYSAIHAEQKAGRTSREELVAVLAQYELAMEWAEMPADGKVPHVSVFHYLCDAHSGRRHPIGAHDTRLRGKRAIISDVGVIDRGIERARDGLDFEIAAERREEAARRPARLARAAAALGSLPDARALGS